MSQITSNSYAVILPFKKIIPDVGDDVTPNISGELNVVGGNNITTTGNYVADSLTLDVSGTTNHAVQIGNATGSLTSLAVGTNGQVLIGATAADAAFGTITSAGATITFTTGANTLNMETGAAVPTSFLTDDTNSAVPALNVLTVAGGANIATTSAGSTVTVTLDGTTDHAVQIGNATNSLTSLAVGNTAQVLKGNTGADPSWGAVDLTTDVSGVLPVGSGGTGVSTITAHSLVVGDGVNALNEIAVGATNQVLLGNTGADPSWGTVGNAALTNSSVTLNNGANITVTGSPLSLGGAATVALNTALTAIDSLTNTNTAFTLNTGTGAIGISTDVAATTVSIANGVGAKTVTVGSNNTTSQLVLQSGSNGINMNSNNGGLVINSGTGVLAISTDASATTLNMATGAAVKTVTIGSTTTTSSLDLKTGTGDFSLSSATGNLVDVTNLGVVTLLNDLDVTEGGTGVSSFTAYAVLCGGTTAGGDLQSVAAVGSAGQVLTSNGAGALPTFQAAGAPGGVTWSAVTVDAGLTVQSGTIANKAGLLTMTLPATAALGDILEFTNINTALGIRVAQNANQYIRIAGSLSTTGVGGYVEATALGDSLKLICIVAGASTGWQATSSMGNWTVA